MKHSKNSGRYLPPRHGSSSGCDDDDRSAAVLKEMAREQSLVTQLRAVVLPALQADDERSVVIAHMFETILDCSAKAMAALKLHRLDHIQARADDSLTVDDKKTVRKISYGCSKEEPDNDAKPYRQRKRRRLADDCVTLETPVPHYDGHQWRKYGQKLINNAKHPRNYFRCTYKQEQGCGATKTVQKQQQDDGTDDDTAMYAVVYYGQHTCNPGDTDAAVNVETASTGHGGGGSDELERSDSQCSNILVTCTSVVVDHHHQTTTTSLESNCELLDMAEYLTTAEVNKDEQLFDMAAYEPLDLWEIDAHGHGIVKFGE